MVNTSKTVTLPPKGHAPMVEDVSPLQSVGVRVAYEGGVTVGVPIGNDEYVLERTRTIVKEGGTDHLARCLDNLPDKQAAALIVVESLGQRTGDLERALDTELALGECIRADNGVRGHMRKSSSYRAQRRHSRFSRRGARLSG